MAAVAIVIAKNFNEMQDKICPLQHIKMPPNKSNIVFRDMNLKRSLKMKNHFNTFRLSVFLSLILFSCQKNTLKETADTILINGNIYTVDEQQPRVAALAIKKDRILKVGSIADIEALKDENTKVIDLKGQFAMPGFIEGHGHFSGLGSSLMNLNFLKSRSWATIVKQVEEAVKKAQPGEWITGRGWHQEKWTEKLERHVHGYPYHDELSEISPDNPVVLRHASGHGLFANKKAMEIAGITKETSNPKGGEIVRDVSGAAIGMFEERAMSLITKAYQDYLNTLSDEELVARWYKGIELAQQECLSKGITSFQDAGAHYDEMERYKKMAEEGQFDVRLWSMLRHSYERMKDNMEGFPIINAGATHTFTCKAIKSEVDGALGSFGAWLLAPYSDKPGFVGQNTTELLEVENIAKLAMESDMQLCVHAIGDRANREVLDIFEATFKTQPDKKDLRWRIEHSQHLDTMDIPRFGKLGVIASMQGIHCTSDAPYAVKRLGETRAKYGAYPWRSLLDNGAVVTNGTDAPVEDVSALESFYASVTRKRADTGLAFFTEQAMTREEAIYSYTLANAYAAFEEDIKGSLEAGKLADIVVLSKDLITCSDEEILDTEVIWTMVGGELKYER